jgi:ADP-ribose pyrophosphatase
MSDKETVWEGKFLKVVVDDGWQYVVRQRITGIVCVVAVTDDRKLVLIEQYRIPVAARVIEMPAGLVGDEAGHEDEDEEVAARRELLEETGYEAAHMERLFDGVVSAGLSDERLTFYLATGCRKVGAGAGDGTEAITVHEVPLDAALDWVGEQRRAGATVDAKAMAILAFWLRPPRLG